MPDLTGTYNVGPDGLLVPLPGDDSGYYVARIRVVDQSGNQSNPNDSNAQVPLVVDNTAPTVTITSPSSGQVINNISSSVLTFTIQTSQNIDLTHFNASSIQLISAGPDGILGDADDVTIPIDSNSVSVKYLNTGTGGPGAEQITFSTLAGTALTNDLYQITLLNTGSDAIRDIAGNVMANPVTQSFAVAVPSLSHVLFVEEGATASSATGTREDPYATISAAMTAATAGDVIAVLPGVYQEQVTLKQFVKLYSADPNSTDASVFTTSTGAALQTIIRAPFEANAPSGTYATITATSLLSLAGLTTEVAGFTIASPLVLDPASGIINPNAVAIEITNSNVTIDKDYVIDGGTGIVVNTSGASGLVPSIYNDGIIGNIDGVIVSDDGTTSPLTGPVNLVNNDFAFNTVGLFLQNTGSSPVQALVTNNIFWENHDQTNARSGYAIYSQNVNKVTLQNNLFYGNGLSDVSQSGATNNLGNGFSPTLLGPTIASAQSNRGNFTGNPAFVFPIDPRPGSDGPANFYIDANFQLEATSAAIDNAWEPSAQTTDFLGKSQVDIPGVGFALANFGPRDIGAFEYGGTGGLAVGGSFRVVTTSVVPIGGATLAAGATTIVQTSPTEITVTFSGNVNPADISATDLVLSGSAINPASPVHATSLTWIDSHTVEFNLVGQFVSSGTLDLSIAPSSIQSTTGATIKGYSDSVVLKIVPPSTPSPTSTTSPTPISVTPSPTTTVTTTPGPVVAPTSVFHKLIHHAKKVIKPVKHVAHKPKPVVHKPVHKAPHKKK